ncbi:SusD family [Candidatus Ornithobacterium hominis]|uniref:RagB/SusD family nutrient uptake outer membrane protein n=1 Tax=Candidatus Ornithobacterium hominis TaxID=2497989 RepID=UPI0024BC785F|nr:RagB/SusD family nutrient uptake outer membrane protein [Candidatus Ornithobacterium hominis]CAI9429678.1 SusD family [Candidatus Ornithobacterium hominis]
MNNRIYIYFICLMFIASCDDYLEVIPESSLNLAVDSEEKIAELLTGAYPEASYFPFLEARTDNVEQRQNGIHNQLNESMFYWEDYDREDLDTPLNYWNACYAGIAQANKALELLATYPKTERVKALYGEAFLLRAYLHFMLVNIWSKPYAPQLAKQSLGIPYVTKPEKNAWVDYDRSTVEDVYQKIEADLKLGISLVNDSYYKNPKFHFNKKAAYAFASRFYLFKGDWEKVISYANYVVGPDPKEFLRKWIDYEKQFLFNRTSLYTAYTAPNESANLLLTTTESRYARYVTNQRYGSTRNTVIRIFDKTGITSCDNAKNLNLQSPYIFSYESNPYQAKFDELSLFGNVGSSNPRGLMVTNVLLTTDETLLNRMEALAMLGRYDEAIDDILAYLKGKFNSEPFCLRENYTTTSVNDYEIYNPFYGMSTQQLALIKNILHLRQKEFYQEGLRWFDLRRYYISLNRKTKNTLYQPLRKDDARKTLQLPQEAIQNGLKPNER